MEISKNTSNSHFQRGKIDKKLIIIYLIIFTEVLGFSMVIPVLPFLGLSLGLDYTQIGLVSSVFSISQLISSPIFGKLSDRYGRKPILLISQTSTFFGFVLLGLANSVWILVLARLVDGLLGSNMTVSQAYISDVTDEESRTKAYGRSSAVFGAGLIFGPLIGGLLSPEGYSPLLEALLPPVSYAAPMFLAAGISFLSIVLVILILPESLVDKKDRFNVELSDIVPIQDMKKFFQNPQIRGKILLFFIYNIGFMLFISSFPLFAKEQISIQAREVGFYMTWIGILRVVLQALAINPLIKKLGEDLILKTGMIALISCMAILSFSRDYLFGFVALAFLAFGTGVCRPIFTSKLSKSVEKKETGSLFGVNNALVSIGQIITPIAGGILLQYMPTPALPIISGFFFSLILVLWRYGFGFSSSSKETYEMNQKTDNINMSK